MTTAPDPSRVRRATGPADLLALAPAVLGFHPEESLVVMTLGDAAEPFHARLDLPDPPDVHAAVEHLVAAARRHGVAAVALLLYTRDAPAADSVAEIASDLFETAGVTVRLCVRADGRRWFGLLGSVGLVPVDGTPYDVGSHPWTAESVLEGRVTYASRDALRSSLVGAHPADLEAVEQAAGDALVRLEGAMRGAGGLGERAARAAARAHLVVEGRWVGRRVRRYLDDGRALDADDAGRLLLALIAVDVRDVAWAEIDRAQATRHVELWRDLARRAPDDLRAAPAALLAFAAWLAGDGALAWCAVDRCHDSEPGYRLADLVAQALEGAVPPSTWTGIDPSALPLFAP
ncbi:MAG: DUF4192 domain-containing protein [Nocardioidaceae bacterium]